MPKKPSKKQSVKPSHPAKTPRQLRQIKLAKLKQNPPKQTKSTLTKEIVEARKQEIISLALAWAIRNKVTKPVFQSYEVFQNSLIITLTDNSQSTISLTFQYNPSLPIPFKPSIFELFSSPPSHYLSSPQDTPPTSPSPT